MKVKELLSDKSKWTFGAFAHNKNNESVLPTDPDAICWCLEGAIQKCYEENWRERSDIRCKIREKLDYFFIANWNDTHTYEEVKQLIEELDI